MSRRDASAFARGLVFAVLAVATPFTSAHAANIVIVNSDGAGEGFNDPTPAAPVGGNSGTTVGQQRLIVFQTAANIWGALLPGTQTVAVNSQFNALTCSSTSGVLGSAGPASITANFTGAEFFGYWYNIALANKQANSDLNGASAEINANFNSSVGLTGCLDGSSWYYGLDHVQGPAGIDLLVVILHEMGHGLGFLTVTDGSSGNFASGLPSLWDRFLLDESTGLHWDQENATQRAASAISAGGLAWDGKATNFMAPITMSKRPIVHVTAPVGIAGDYPAAASSFGPVPGIPGVTGQVVLAVDNSAPTGDGCSAFTNAVAMNGKIAFVDRGNCTFVTKAQNAQAAGAVGLIIANNTSGLSGPGGWGPGITIPVVMISQADGNTLRAQLAGGVTATLTVDPGHLAGVHDPDNRMLMYAPNPYQGGSSVSHWDTSAFPNLLMEPSINTDLSSSVDMTRYLFEDIGWFPRTTDAPLPDGRPVTFAASPNPFVAGTTVRFVLARSGLVDLTLYDVGGRVVRHLARNWMPAGTHVLGWDGVTDGGAPTPAGVYLARLKGPDGGATARVVRVR